MDVQNGTAASMVIRQVPESLKKLTLIVAKVFYGPEQFVLADYIQRKTIVKEDVIRDLLKIDQKHLRQMLLQLKIDKLLKERVVSEEGEGRAKKAYYYFINYKAVMNVTKYKLDHMRQKLESREKDEVHKIAYKCTNATCCKQYEDMDVGKIYDVTTEEMRCWQCGHVVEADESAGPSNQTRISLAKFNDQTAGIFSMLQSLNGVSFAQEILEPPIIAPDAGDQPKEETQKVQRVGERAFNASGKTRTELYGSGITVSIGGDSGPAIEAKEAVPWLQSTQQPMDSVYSMPLGDATLVPEMPNNFNAMMDGGALPGTKSAPNLTALQSTSAQAPVGSPLAKRPKRQDIASLLLEEEGHSMEASASVPNLAKAYPTGFQTMVSKSVAETQESEPAPVDGPRHTGDDDDEEEEEESFVMVQGKQIPIDHVTDEIVAQMTADEKDTYIKSVQRNFYYY